MNGGASFARAGSIPAQQIWDGVIGRPVHGERMTIALLELAPGAVVPEHSHDNEQVGFLVEGSLSFTVGGECEELTPGGSWRILSHVPHSLVVGPEGAVVVEAFAPGRSDWLSLPEA